VADALIKINAQGPDPLFQDGDIIGIYTDDQILMKNAEIVCGANRFGKPAPNVYRPTGGLEQLWYESLYRYKHVRRSKFEMEKIDLWRGGSEIRTVPTLPQNITRRMSHTTHSIFGSPGGEFWYKGAIDFGRVNALWDAIEASSANIRTDNMRMPFGVGDFKVHLCVTCDNMTQAEAAALLGPEKDGEEKVIRKRHSMVPWQDGKFGLTNRQKNDAKNRNKISDERAVMRVKVADIEAKP